MLARHESEAEAVLDASNERVPHVLAYTGYPPVSGSIEE